ncbi:universal stress family protein [Asticcacaulis biprosthecium C19]|uniref:Universal stress family protein n=2 Tax=Asticcacaulis biprosthecium TaxID=76891 RepID=F4QH93_9CAUL|nr:universal stress family protein [Asticcacaulis biprosthecium C19]
MCLFGGETYELNALDTAFHLTRTSGGRLQVVHVASPPVLFEVLRAADSSSSGEGVTAVLETDARHLADAALALVTKRSTTHAVPLVASHHPILPDQALVTFCPLMGPVARCLPDAGRCVDLIVIGQDGGRGGHTGAVLTALFHTGSPVLVVPSVSDAPLSSTGYARNVAVAWDGSLTASRALRAALPHLSRADSVHLVSVEGMGDPYDATGEAAVLAYLACHGISADFIRAERVAHSIGHILLEKAGDLDADLLVAGAYGYGHMGELSLGSVSNHILKHAHLPLLLAH